MRACARSRCSRAVQSLLLAPHVVLADAGVPVDSILDESVLARLGRAGRPGLPAHRRRPRPRERRRPQRGAPPAEPGPAAVGARSGSTGAGRWPTCGGRPPASTTPRSARSSTTWPPTSTGWRRWPAAAATTPRPADGGPRRHRPRLGDDAARQLGRSERLAPRRPRGAAPGGRPPPRRRLVRGLAAPHVPPRAGRGRRHPVDDPPREGSGVGPRRRVRRHRGPRCRTGCPPTSRRSDASSTSASRAAASASLVLGDRTRRSPFLGELDGSARRVARSQPPSRRRPCRGPSRPRRPASRPSMPAEVGQAVRGPRWVRGHDRGRSRKGACASTSTTADRSSSGTASG